MSQLTQAAFEALYNSSGSGTFAANAANAIGSASFRAFAKDISDTFFGLLGNNPDVTYRFSDDFVAIGSSIPSLNGSTSGAGAGTSLASTYGVDNTSHAIGVVSFSTGTTTTGYCYLISPGTAVLKFSYGHAITLKFRIATEALSDGTNTYTLYLGFGDGVVGAEHSNGAYFKYTHGINGGKYQCVTANAATRTATDSGIAQDTSYHTFEIRIASDGTSVVFLIDGNIVATNTTNIPTANGSQIAFGIVKSLGTTARLIDMDWYGISIIRTVKR